jgi:hypothetical protein
MLFDEEVGGRLKSNSLRLCAGGREETKLFFFSSRYPCLGHLRDNASAALQSELEVELSCHPRDAAINKPVFGVLKASTSNYPY